MKILIIGKIPPPIGGVTIHVQRLLDNLDKEKYPFLFVNLHVRKFPIIIIEIFKHNIVHLHSSNTFFKLFIALVCAILNKKLIITNHGNLERYGNYKDTLDKLSLKYCYLPIVLNDFSYQIALRFNKKVQKISSFIPPVKEVPLDDDIINNILLLKTRGLIICCTNASAYHIDKNDNDIYGIKELIIEFNKSNKHALIISDPTGDYYTKYFNISNSNIFFINKKHSYYEVIKFSDITIRNTTTDGDSISIKESLYLNKLTLATNCIDRPDGTIQYEKFNLSLLNITKHNESNGLDGFKELIDLYNNA